MDLAKAHTGQWELVLEVWGVGFIEFVKYSSIWGIHNTKSPELLSLHVKFARFQLVHD